MAWWQATGCMVLVAAGACASPGDTLHGQSPDAHRLARQVVALSDHGRLPFAVVDKRLALLLVFHADGSLAGSTAALLGNALGDHSMPGVGGRTQQGKLRNTDRTTPAGRFDAEPGVNLAGEPVVWLDHGAALAIHRLRGGPLHASRTARLAADDAERRRVSAGCVVVPAAFYTTVVQPLLGRQHSTVYVLPERGGDLPLPARGSRPPQAQPQLMTSLP